MSEELVEGQVIENHAEEDEEGVVPVILFYGPH